MAKSKPKTPVPPPPREILKRGGRTPYLETWEKGDAHIGLDSLVKVPAGVATAIKGALRAYVRCGKRRPENVGRELLLAAMIDTWGSPRLEAVLMGAELIARADPKSWSYRLLGGDKGKRWFLGWREHWRLLRAKDGAERAKKDRKQGGQ